MVVVLVDNSRRKKKKRRRAKQSDVKPKEAADGVGDRRKQWDSLLL